jgi:prevent-host-death family protein
MYHYNDTVKTELVTSLKRKATDIIHELAHDREPVLITEHGKPAAYLVDVETFESLDQKMKILEGLARGEKDIRGGNVRTLPEARSKLKKWLR